MGPIALVTSLSEMSPRSSSEYCAGAEFGPSALSGGGKDVCRSGCADAEWTDGLRLLDGSARPGTVGRCRGSASDDGPGGEPAG